MKNTVQFLTKDTGINLSLPEAESGMTPAETIAKILYFNDAWPVKEQEGGELVGEGPTWRKALSKEAREKIEAELEVDEDVLKIKQVNFMHTSYLQLNLE